jgi:uncharacterized protein (DUF1499 family)
MLGIFGRRSRAGGVREGKLSPCPSTPNCVCSHDSGAQFVAPFTYTCSREKAVAALLAVLETAERARIVRREAEYLHVVFTSRLLRFKDDVEFSFAEPGVLHVRSASRLGYSDLGANRSRVELIRRRWARVLQPVQPNPGSQLAQDRGGGKPAAPRRRGRDS